MSLTFRQEKEKLSLPQLKTQFQGGIQTNFTNKNFPFIDELKAQQSIQKSYSFSRLPPGHAISKAIKIKFKHILNNSKKQSMTFQQPVDNQSIDNQSKEQLQDQQQQQQLGLQQQKQLQQYIPKIPKALQKKNSGLHQMLNNINQEDLKLQFSSSSKYQTSPKSQRETIIPYKIIKDGSVTSRINYNNSSRLVDSPNNNNNNNLNNTNNANQNNQSSTLNVKRLQKGQLFHYTNNQQPNQLQEIQQNSQSQHNNFNNSITVDQKECEASQQQQLSNNNNDSLSQTLEKRRNFKNYGNFTKIRHKPVIYNNNHSYPFVLNSNGQFGTVQQSPILQKQFLNREKNQIKFKFQFPNIEKQLFQYSMHENNDKPKYSFFDQDGKQTILQCKSIPLEGGDMKKTWDKATQSLMSTTSNQIMCFGSTLRYQETAFNSNENGEYGQQFFPSKQQQILQKVKSENNLSEILVKDKCLLGQNNKENNTGFQGSGEGNASTVGLSADQVIKDQKNRLISQRNDLLNRSNTLLNHFLVSIKQNRLKYRQSANQEYQIQIPEINKILYLTKENFKVSQQTQQPIHNQKQYLVQQPQSSIGDTAENEIIKDFQVHQKTLNARKVKENGKIKVRSLTNSINSINQPQTEINIQQTNNNNCNAPPINQNQQPAKLNQQNKQEGTDYYYPHNDNGRENQTHDQFYEFEDVDNDLNEYMSRVKNVPDIQAMQPKIK